MNKPTLPSAWPGLMPPISIETLRIRVPEHYYPVKPASLLNPNWKYTPSDQTDVQRTWARFGWKPTQR